MLLLIRLFFVLHIEILSVFNFYNTWYILYSSASQRNKNLIIHALAMRGNTDCLSTNDRNKECSFLDLDLVACQSNQSTHPTEHPIFSQFIVINE